MPDFKLNNCPIFLQDKLREKTGELFTALKLNSPVILVTDQRVKKLYEPEIRLNLKNAGFKTVTVEVPRGERAKNLEETEKLYRRFLDYQVDRSSTILALGGGCVSDLTAFAASTFMRGIPLVLMPTTLLAQVDAALGGKTGVNLPQGKNLTGTFYFPQAVLIDPGFLGSLEEKEYRCGLAEVIKAALIKSSVFFQELEADCLKLKEQKGDRLENIIRRAVEIKIQVVQADPLEKGERAILNFGHTLGHAFEAAGRYQAYNHGEAVALGMLAATRLSQQILNLDPQIVTRLHQLLLNLGLPTRLQTLSNPDIFEHLLKDKKKSGSLKMVLLQEIGKPVITECPAFEQIAGVLQELRQAPV